MRLRQYKARYLKRLAMYSPRDQRERELRDLLVNKLEYLRSATMPFFLRTLYEVAEHEPVSEDFRSIVREMIRDAPVEEEDEDQALSAEVRTLAP